MPLQDANPTPSFGGFGLMYDPMRRTYEDMPALKYKVELNESERTHLKEIASRGETSARKVKRALVLLKADEGLIDRDIASGLLISASTVGRVRTQYVQEGLDSALIERPRPGQRRKLDGRQEAKRESAPGSRLVFNALSPHRRGPEDDKDGQETWFTARIASLIG